MLIDDRRRNLWRIDGLEVKFRIERGPARDERESTAAAIPTRRRLCKGEDHQDPLNQHEEIDQGR